MIHKCNILVKYSFLYLLALTIGNFSLLGQTIVSGKVVDDQGKFISEANITAEQPGTRNILAFTFSDGSGEFELKLNTDLDTIFLVVSHISFNTKEVLITTNNKIKSLVLSPRNEVLPEVIVKTEPIIRKGDTLVFDMQRYARDADENIEDVLRRLPGIAIEDNGRIFYRGQAISRFYIEGLDLLEGKYKIATRNLNKNTVLDIEIIEHHQSKKVLKDLVRPNEAAINLKLKSNIAITGSVEAGLAVAPLNHLIGTDIFGFKKKFQFHTHVSSNDLGRNQKNQYENLYESHARISKRLVSVNRVFPPLSLDQDVYINNNERIAGFDILRKISSTSQIKWHFRYTKDRLKTVGNEILTFRFSEDSIRQITDFQTTAHPSNLENTFIFELNSDFLFIRANNKVHAEWLNVNGAHLFNQQPSPEQLLNRSISAYSNLEFTFRKGNKAQTIYTDINFNMNSDSLEVENTDLIVPEALLRIHEDLLQVLDIQELDANTYSSFFSKKGVYTRNITTGVQYSSQGLRSNLLKSNPSEPLSTTANIFGNDYTLKEWGPYLNQSHRIESKNASWNLSIPVQWYHFDLNDEIGMKRRKDNFLLFDVELEYQRLTNKEYGLNINYTYSHNYDDFDNYFYEGYILRANRSLSRLSQQINRYKRHSLSFYIDRNNVLKGIYYRLGARYHRSKYDLIENESFFNQGTTSNLGFKENIRHRAMIDGVLSGQLTNRMDFSTAIDFSYNNRPLQINQESSRVNYTSLFSKIKLSHVFKNSVVSLSSSILKQSSNLFPISSDQLTMKIVYFLKNKTLGAVRISYEPYLIITQDVNQWNHLLRLEMKREIKNKRIEMSLQLLNLTNASSFNFFEQNSYFSDYSSVKLRPFQIQVVTTKKF